MEVRQLDVPDTDVIQVGEGPDFLLLHTLLAERTVFDRVLPKLAAKYRLTIPNLPGYGATPPLEGDAPVVAPERKRRRGNRRCRPGSTERRFRRLEAALQDEP